MDFLQDHSDALQKTIFHTVAVLFNLEVDLLFIDTTTTCFEIDGEDADFCEVDENGEESTHPGYRRRSKHGKDNHPELSQVVICFAVTRSGIPVKCWSWPGNTSDEAIINEIKSDLNLWDLGRAIYVEDTGFNSEKNRRILRGAGDHYIIGEKLGIGRNAEVNPALKHPGKFKKLAAIERVFRDMKHLIDIRPVYHRLEQRIRYYILLCSLAMLLIRIAENETGQTCFQMKKIFNNLHLGTLKTPQGVILQTSELTPEMKKLFTALKVDTPKKVVEITT